MNEARIQMLESIGFLWDVHSKQWDDRLLDLLAYKRIKGHCNVPRYCHQYAQLATWVKRQRRQYASGKLPQDRIQRLESIGFQWRVRDTQSKTAASRKSVA